MGQSTTVIPTGGGGAKVQDSIPTNPQKGDLWVDTTETPPVTKWYDGTAFNRITPGTTDTESLPLKTVELDTQSFSGLNGELFGDGVENTVTFNVNGDIPPSRFTTTAESVDKVNPSGNGGWDVTISVTGAENLSHTESITAYGTVADVSHTHSL